MEPTHTPPSPEPPVEKKPATTKGFGLPAQGERLRPASAPTLPPSFAKTSAAGAAKLSVGQRLAGMGTALPRPLVLGLGAGVLTLGLVATGLFATQDLRHEAKVGRSLEKVEIFDVRAAANHEGGVLKMGQAGGENDPEQRVSGGVVVDSDVVLEGPETVYGIPQDFEQPEAIPAGELGTTGASTLSIPGLEIDVPVEYLGLEQSGGPKLPQAPAVSVATAETQLGSASGRTVVVGSLTDAQNKYGPLAGLVGVASGDLLVSTDQDRVVRQWSVISLEVVPADKLAELLAVTGGPRQLMLVGYSPDGGQAGFTDAVVVTAVPLS